MLYTVATGSNLSLFHCEKNVFDAIVAKGYQVIPQYEVAGFRMDLVVQGGQSKLAVECYGDHWHTSVEERERDFLRERLL